MFPLTGVVVFGAVAQLLLIPHDELRQGETVRHLHRPVLQPLEDQVIHGVADWRQRDRRAFRPASTQKPRKEQKAELTTLQLHRAGLDVHGKVLQIHRAGQDESQPAGQVGAVSGLYVHVELIRPK